MDYKIDFSIATSQALEDALGGRLEEIRLSRNITQEDLARAAGVSCSTVKRMTQGGKGISLDSFLRIIQALELSSQLQTFLPDPDDSPLLQLAQHGKRRRRARHSSDLHRRSFAQSSLFEQQPWNGTQEAVREWNDEKWPWEHHENTAWQNDTQKPTARKPKTRKKKT